MGVGGGIDIRSSGSDILSFKIPTGHTDRVVEGRCISQKGELEPDGALA